MIQSCIAIGLSGLAVPFYIGLWFIFRNLGQKVEGGRLSGRWVNNRLDLIACAIGCSLLLGMEGAWYLMGDFRKTRLDAVAVQFDLPIWTGVQVFALVWGIAIFLGMDYHMYVAMLFKVVAIFFCMTMGVLSGDPANESKVHAFWFLVAGWFTVCLAVMAAWGNKRDVDNMAWLIMGMTLAPAALISGAWMFGQSFQGDLNLLNEFWCYFAAKYVLCIGITLAMVLIQGERGSIIYKWTKGKFPPQPDGYAVTPGQSSQ